MSAPGATCTSLNRSPQLHLGWLPCRARDRQYGSRSICSQLESMLLCRWKAGDWRMQGTSTSASAVIYICTGGPCGERPCGGPAPQPACPAGNHKVFTSKATVLRIPCFFERQRKIKLDLFYLLL